MNRIFNKLTVALIVTAVICALSAISFGQRVAVAGDIQGASAATLNVSDLIKSWNPDFIITLGDNHYDNTGTIDDQVGQFYSGFISPYYGVYGAGDTVNRFFPAIGNHDCEAGNYNNYLNYFTLPGNERYYDFVRGDIHFFALNCTAAEPDGVTDSSVQAQWLQANLAQSVSEYKIVYFHYPPYSSGWHGSTAFMQWPFRQWGATAVFSGHDHDYERLAIDSFPYYVAGTSGPSLYTVYNPLPGSEFFYCGSHGAILMTADSDSLSIDFITTSDSLVEHSAIKSMVAGNTANTAHSKTKIRIYPNPAGDYITLSSVEAGGAEPREISISDYTGRTVLSKKISTPGNTIDISSLCRGLYFVYCNKKYCGKFEVLN